jgi:hypothetical protein
MSIYAELNTHPSRKDLLSFGLVFAAGMGAFGAWFQTHGRPERALVFFVVGGAVFLLSLIPPVGRLLYILWMGFGLTVGFFTVPIIMFALYALAVVPLGLWFRLRRRDTMRRKLDPSAKSYWEDYPGSEDPESYVRQF